MDVKFFSCIAIQMERKKTGWKENDVVIVRNRLRKNTQVGKLGETKKSKNLTAMKGGLQKKKKKSDRGVLPNFFYSPTLVLLEKVTLFISNTLFKVSIDCLIVLDRVTI